MAALRAACPTLPHLMVDGGINADTASLAASAGANVLVSGSYLFGSAPGAMAERIDALEASLLQHGD